MLKIVTMIVLTATAWFGNSLLAIDDPPAADAAKKSIDTRITRDEARKLPNPVPFTKESIAKGRIGYIRDCTDCHGADGKSELDVVANATNLTDPKLWTSGTTEGEIYRSIRDGAGDGMPPFSDRLSDDDMWHLVNFIRNWWPEQARGKLQDKTN